MSIEDISVSIEDISVSIEDVNQAHNRRLSALDPLLPEATVPEVGAGETLLWGESRGAVAVGVTETVVCAPNAESALWGALRRHVLTVRLSGADLAGATAALLDRWEQHLAERVEPGDEEAAALVVWPSRDSAGVSALALRGFAPLLVLAVRQPATTASAMPGASPAVIRPAAPDDLPAITELALHLQRHDARFGLVTERPTAREILAAGLKDQIRAGDDWVLVAELDGRVVGLSQVQPPARAGWIAPKVASSPAAYLGSQYTRPEVRGTGIGSALVVEVHRRLDDAGVAATLLHHALPNELSTPFWYRHGYRPLWTTWQRRPARR